QASAVFRLKYPFYEKHYDIDLLSVRRNDLTLGELYARIQKVA
ncbi:MAG: hypothetical protein QOD99_2467, partial [Chthoniobacter sp.]|nr:hypothetical protein [Chthoniobacter sp.]